MITSAPSPLGQTRKDSTTEGTQPRCTITTRVDKEGLHNRRHPATMHHHHPGRQGRTPQQKAPSHDAPSPLGQTRKDSTTEGTQPRCTITTCVDKEGLHNRRHPATMHLFRDALAPAIFNDNPDCRQRSDSRCHCLFRTYLTP